MIPPALLPKVTLFAIIALACISSNAPAQNSQFKIGVVDLRKVFDEYTKQKEKYEELVVEKDKLQKPIDELSAKITEDRKRYKDEASDLADTERLLLQDEIESQEAKYMAALQQSQAEIDRKEKRIFEEILRDIQMAVEEVGARENYHLIFDGGKNRNNNLLYYSTTLNMTRKVIDHLNNK